jgi:hypothetical protein
MLKEKNTATTELESHIVAVKLITGEEIIAKLDPASTNQLFKFQRPLAMVLGEVPGKPHQTQVMFTPWMLALDENEVASVRNEHVVAIAAARKDAAIQYESATNPE